MDILKGQPDFYLGLIFSLLSSIAVLFIYPKVIFNRLSNKLEFDLFNSNLNIAMSLIYLLSSMVYFELYGYKFRHQGGHLADVSRFYMVMIVFKIYFSAYILSKLAQLSFNYTLSRTDKIALIIIFISNLFSIEGSFDIAKNLIVGILLVKAFTKFDFLFSIKQNRSKLAKLYSTFFMGLGGFFALFVGISNKRGIDRTLEFFMEESFLELIILPLRRVSYHLYSLSYHVNYSFFNIDLQGEAFFNLIYKIIGRIQIFFGIESISLSAKTVNRLNSLSIYEYAKPTNGVSPGWAAGPFFMPYFPFSFFLWAIFTALVLKIFSDLFSGTSKASVFVVLYCLVYFQSIMDESISVLNPLSKSFIYLFLFSLVWFFQKRNIAKVEIV